ncbi:hypothetical protein ACLB2K_005458 [Fragaria x ananassa]
MDEDYETWNPYHGFMEDVNGNASNNVYTPEVADEYAPKVGQIFDSLEEVYEFYNNYAKMGGFGIRRHSQKTHKGSNDITRKEFVCYKQGNYEKKVDDKGIRSRGVVRCGCEAKIAVLQVEQSTMYRISTFVEEHNHLLANLEEVHMLTSHRKVSDAKKLLTKQLALVNVPTYKQFGILEVQAGGIQNIGCTKRDLYNYARDLRSEYKGHDADMVNEHFLCEKSKNDSFFYKMEADGDDKLTHCFWADARSRSSYKLYGDAIVFDTTYNTNRYGMIFAPILGVNNHGQTIVFGCGFLNNETTESFIWLFEQFKEAMQGDLPKIIITDQDPAIAKAISQVFPGTFHRFCIWHIMNKFSEKIGACAHQDTLSELKKCVWDSDTKEEFDARWKEVIDRAKLHENAHDWFSSIYDLRSRWVPAYVKHVFSAGMSASSRAEGDHAFFKGYVSKSNTLMDFILRFNRGLAHQRHEELIATHVDVNQKPLFKMPMMMERQMAEIYTRKIFKKFQVQLWLSWGCVLEVSSDNDNLCVYKVTERRKDGSLKVREVTVDKAVDNVACSCKRFEFEGIVCRHILAYMKWKQTEHLPDHYILKRWTRTAKSNLTLEEHGKNIDDFGDDSLLMRQTTLSRIASELIDGALVSIEACKLLEEDFESTRKKIKLLVDSTTNVRHNGSEGNVSSDSCGGLDANVNGDISEGTEQNVACLQPQHFDDPLPVRAKGCGKRLKGGKEKAMERKGRHCSICKQVGHNKQKCPTLSK